MHINRRAPRNQLAFLDVMACGLGAVVLLFLLVKHHAETAREPDTGARLATQAAESAQLNTEAVALAARIEQVQREVAQHRKQKVSSAAGRKQLAALEHALQQAEARKLELSNHLQAMDPHQATDVIEERQVGEEAYLLGLKVTGERIAVLMDRSASMTDVHLVDIISRKVRADAEKQGGAKWRRTLRTMRWLLQRVPAASEVAVIAFNDQAQVLGNGGWQGGRDSKVLTGLFQALEQLVPTGATNLEAGLRTLGTLSPQATDVYVLTDGLPTQSIHAPARGCARGRRKISGECREALFYASLRKSAPPPGVKVHVILLPLEGDPQAAPAYWNWTAQAGGLLLTPAPDWP